MKIQKQLVQFTHLDLSQDIFHQLVNIMPPFLSKAHIVHKSTMLSI